MIHMSMIAKLRLFVISISLVTLGILWEQDPKLSEKFSWTEGNPNKVPLQKVLILGWKWEFFQGSIHKLQKG